MYEIVIQQPREPGVCDICGGPIGEPDPRVSISRRERLCSRRCENREKHRREQAKYNPEFDRERRCERKKRFHTPELAEAAIAKYGRESIQVAYPCPYCGGWHNGRRDGSTPDQP